MNRLPLSSQYETEQNKLLRETRMRREMSVPKTKDQKKNLEPVQEGGGVKGWRTDARVSQQVRIESCGRGEKTERKERALVDSTNREEMGTRSYRAGEMGEVTIKLGERECFEIESV